jgi:translation initiation factor IF-3
MMPSITFNVTPLRISRRKFRPKAVKVVYLVNENIRFPEVRVIDDEAGHVGVMPTEAAIKMAKEKDVDLVVIQPNAVPPIAKIIDFGRYKYEQDKEAQKQKAKQKTVEVKGIRLSVRIGPHDMEVRKEKAKEFLDEGNKVKVEIILRGREKRFGDLGRSVIDQFIALLNKDVPVKVEVPFARQGGQLTTIVGKA